MILIVLYYILAEIHAPPWAYLPLALHFCWSVFKFFNNDNETRDK